jgi:hypothetical protein
MKTQTSRLVFVLLASALLLAACGTSYDTNFPMPDSVSNFDGAGGDSPINYQTELSLDEVLAFYRAEFEAAGMTEREINTSITDTTVSLVFDGHSSGQAVVLQAVDLGSGSTNVNVRLEDI